MPIELTVLTNKADPKLTRAILYTGFNGAAIGGYASSLSRPTSILHVEPLALFARLEVRRPSQTGCLTSGRFTPACDGRSEAQRLSGANACGRVVAGAPAWHGPLLFSCVHENRADVCVFAWMAGKSVS